MPSAGEIRAQVAVETERRQRLAVPAVASGILFLLGTIIIATTLSGAPTVGLLQGLAPAFSGEATPAESPRAAEVKFISQHAFGLIAGSVLTAFAIVVLTFVLMLLFDATRFRRPQLWAPARPLALVGGLSLAVVSVAHQIVGAIQTHNFAVGHDHTNHAADQALTKGAANQVVQYLDLLAGVALAAGMIAIALNAMRVGLLARWLGILGMFTAVLLFLPLGGAELEIIPAFWLVATGILLGGRWPGGDPPAWAAGEARPWPTAAERRGQQPGGRAAKTKPALSTAGGDVAPEPTPARTSPSSSRKRRRKRGGRG